MVFESEPKEKRYNDKFKLQIKIPWNVSFLLFYGFFFLLFYIFFLQSSVFFNGMVLPIKHYCMSVWIYLIRIRYDFIKRFYFPNRNHVMSV